MRLNRDALEFLRQHVAAVADTDLATTYAFEHPLNAEQLLAFQRVEFDEFTWGVWIRSTTCFVVEAPIMRRISPNCGLLGSEASGLVAFNEACMILQEFRRNKLGRAVYTAEERLYRAWGVREIQMRAAEQGRWVWVRKFNFLPSDPGTFAEAYADWAVGEGVDPSPPEKAADYPEAFLSTLPPIILYKELA